MPPKASSKNSIKNSSLVPVLFTLGVVGWGFFAIDRLTSSTSPSYQDYTSESHDFSSDSEANKKSWKKSTEEFIGKFTSQSGNSKKDSKRASDKAAASVSTNEKALFDEERDPESENWTIVSDEPLEQKVKKKEEKISSKIESNSTANNAYFLYFYRNNNGQLKLSQIIRKTGGPVILKNLFREIVAGPSFLNDNKQLIDSFPVKPTVIDAYINDSTIVLNLDDNFGHGISFETAQLQLEQIIKTSSQFKNINSVQFLINSEEVESIQVDGLSIPAHIKTNRPVALSRNQENEP